MKSEVGMEQYYLLFNKKQCTIFITIYKDCGSENRSLETESQSQGLFILMNGKMLGSVKQRYGGPLLE